MPHEMLGCVLRTAAIGHGYGVDLGIPDQLIECHDVDTGGDDVAEGVLSTIGRSYHQPIDLPSHQGLNFGALGIYITTVTCQND